MSVSYHRQLPTFWRSQLPQSQCHVIGGHKHSGGPSCHYIQSEVSSRQQITLKYHQLLNWLQSVITQRFLIELFTAQDDWKSHSVSSQSYAMSKKKLPLILRTNAATTHPGQEQKSTHKWPKLALFARRHWAYKCARVTETGIWQLGQNFCQLLLGGTAQLLNCCCLIIQQP
jgi:hypothetical protein